MVVGAEGKPKNRGNKNMIKDANNFPVLYWIEGSAAVCPSCGNGNAMLDKSERVPGGNYVLFFVCRDCGFKVSENKQTSVVIHMDVENRCYHSTAADGVEVDLAGFDDPRTGRPGHGPLFNYLRNHPTPDTW